MVQITLHFVTLAAARAALLEIPQTSLVGGLSTEALPAAAVKIEAPKPVKAEKPAKVEAPVAEAVAAPVVEEPAAPAAATAVDYPTLQKAVFALAGKSREAAAAVAADLGVKTFKELTEDKWAEALAAVNAALAEAA